MEKLIELLNEYDWTPTEWKQIWDKIYFDWLGWNSELHELIIISKYYGFIQWLIDNDKIDLDKVKEIWIKHNGKMDVDGLYRYSVYERLLMLLSISDTPIEDLISYLK